MDLVLFGIQGSGKGTQAKKLCSEFGYEQFEAGGELRKIAASGSELGNTVKSYIDAGHLVPHEIIMKVVKEAVMARPKDQKVLFDGIPRDLDQMRDFDAIMKEAGRDFTALQILLTREQGIQRILGRAKAEGRKDDSDLSIINRRMDTFEEKTRPVIEEYRKQGRLIDIQGNRGVEEVYGDLKKVIKI
jgi:adenylate kinase